MDKLKVVSWNCHSITNKRSEFDCFVSQNDLDIIILSETWLKDGARFSIPGFKSFLVNREYGGVAILAKKIFQSQESQRLLSATLRLFL